MRITSDSGLTLEVLEILESGLLVKGQAEPFIIQPPSTREAVLLIDGNDSINKVRAAESLGYAVFCDAIHI